VRSFFFGSFFDGLERRCVIKQSYMRYSLHIKTHMPEDILKMICYFFVWV